MLRSSRRSAIQGNGVTATLRAAVARILDNIKNNVDTTLYEEPAAHRAGHDCRIGSHGRVRGDAEAVHAARRAARPCDRMVTAPGVSPAPAGRSRTTPFASIAVAEEQITFDEVPVEVDDPFSSVTSLHDAECRSRRRGSPSRECPTVVQSLRSGAGAGPRERAAAGGEAARDRVAMEPAPADAARAPSPSPSPGPVFVAQVSLQEDRARTSGSGAAMT